MTRDAGPMPWWHKRWPDLAQTLAFLAVMWICLWRWVDVGLIYHGGGEIVDFSAFY